MRKHNKAGGRHPAATIGIDLGDEMSRYVIRKKEGLAVEEGSFRYEGRVIAKHFVPNRSQVLS